jgi:predicted TIM-barrel fold metal-dependent hydrolase
MQDQFSRKREPAMRPDITNLKPIPDDVFVIDPVIHAFNLSEANVASRYGAQLHAMSYGLHAGFSPPEATIEQPAYMTDMPIEALLDTVFLESQTKGAAHHTLTLNTWFKDGFCSREKTVAGANTHPDRCLAYLGVDPCEDESRFIEDLIEQHEEIPQAVGLKLYPHQVDPYRRWRADDDKVLRLVELARKRGLKSIAIHKALPNGSVPLESYKVDDLDIAADSFPDMAFEIIHSGMAFVEETAFAISRFPNVYANLETTTALLWAAPGRFSEVLGQLMFWGGPEKIIYSTGCTVIHPQHVLSLFWDFQFTEDTLSRVGVPPIDDQIKRMILGGNYARMIGLDIDEAAGKIAGDSFDRRLEAQGGLAPPWTHWRAHGEAAA